MNDQSERPDDGPRRIEAEARARVEALFSHGLPWAEAEEARILANGTPLDAVGLELAKEAGVRDADRVRLLQVPEVPMPTAEPIRSQLAQAGLISSGNMGMALGHGIFLIPAAVGDKRTLMHELTHVAQVERLGGLRPFLSEYLFQCLMHGYANSEFEQKAYRNGDRYLASP